jgi:hypothetical protein
LIDAAFMCFFTVLALTVGFMAGFLRSDVPFVHVRNDNGHGDDHAQDKDPHGAPDAGQGRVGNPRGICGQKKEKGGGQGNAGVDQDARAGGIIHVSSTPFRFLVASVDSPGIKPPFLLLPQCRAG